MHYATVDKHGFQAWSLQEGRRIYIAVGRTRVRRARGALKTCHTLTVHWLGCWFVMWGTVTPPIGGGEGERHPVRPVLRIIEGGKMIDQPEVLTVLRRAA